MALTRTRSTNRSGLPKSRLERALELREPAIAVLRRHGKWETWGNGAKMLVANVGGFDIQYRTPFQKGHGPSDQMLAQAAARGVHYIRFPYAMYIYAAHHHYPKGHGNVMSLEWGAHDQFRMTVFRSGDWEDRLVQLFNRDDGAPASGNPTSFA